jgi:hypothetical protein
MVLLRGGVELGQDHLAPGGAGIVAMLSMLTVHPNETAAVPPVPQ